MKKLLAIVLALTLALSLSVTAFATDTYEGGNPTPITVTGTYVAGATASDSISVTVVWDEMNFTYTGASQGTWNSSTHEYTGGTEGGWTTDTKTITVTNHSNVAVSATLAFTPEATGVIGTFTENSGTAGDKVLELATAVGTASTNAPSATANFGIGGDPITENKDLGTITVTIAKNGPTVVTTYDQLAAAVNYGGNIELGADIDMGANNLTLGNGTQGTIDLGGYKLISSDNAIEIESGANFTIKNGTINSTDSVIYAIRNYGTLAIEDCTITSQSVVLRNESSASARVTNTSLISYGMDEPIYSGGNNNLTFSGTVNITGYNNATGGINNAANSTIIVLPGTYNFNPTSYVDTDSYKVTTNSNGTWTVAEK